jgi:uncharacterized protein (TIGR03067 family)
MRRLFLPVLAAGLLLAAAAFADEAKTDGAALQGTWRLASLEVDGRPIAVQDMVPHARLVISGTKYAFTLDDTRLELTPKLDPAKKPKAIDLTVAEGPQKGQTFHGIYKLEGDTYTVCRSTDPGQARPTAFATKPKSGLMLVVWKRDKP